MDYNINQHGINQSKKFRYFLSGNITNEHLKWQDFREIEVTNDKGKTELRKVAYYVIEKNGVSQLIQDVPEFREKDIGYISVKEAPDHSKIFTHDGAICVLSDGTIVASTPTTLLAIGPKGIKDDKNYDIELGEGPDLIRPTISRFNSSKFEYAHIDDETMPGQFMLYDMISGLGLLYDPKYGMK